MFQKTRNDLLKSPVVSGENEGHIREADLQKAYLAKEEEVTKEMRRIGEEALQQAREEFTSAQEKFNNAANTMPGGKLATTGIRLCL